MIQGPARLGLGVALALLTCSHHSLGEFGRKTGEMGVVTPEATTAIQTQFSTLFDQKGFLDKGSEQSAEQQYLQLGTLYRGGYVSLPCEILTPTHFP